MKHGLKEAMLHRKEAMLKFKYLFENFELARLALTHWEYNEENLDKYLKYFRISSNAMYPFERYEKRCFLRLAPMEEKQENNLRGELEFLQYLQSKGYPSMVPVASKEGEFLLQLDTRWGKYYAGVFEGVPGKPIEDTDYNAEIMFSYGKALGKLHCLSMEYEGEHKPLHKKWNYEDALCWIKEVLQEYNAPCYMLEEVEKLEKELAELPRTKENYGLVHYDFEPDNVFYEETSGECHVIDFEDGMYHFFLVDIEQVFDALAQELSGETLLHARKSFLQGYTSEKVLEPEYEKLLPLMRRFCNLFAYARMIRCIAEEIQEAPEWMCKLRNILQRKINFLEKNVDNSESI